MRAASERTGAGPGQHHADIEYQLPRPIKAEQNHFAARIAGMRLVAQPPGNRARRRQSRGRAALLDRPIRRSDAALKEEVFGASSLLVRCRDLGVMRELLEDIEGQLTVTLQMDDADMDAARTLLPTLERKAGRVLVNGWPTGVEVAPAMVHGGPFPATSDGRSTSVGTLAIRRFLRPVCYQDMPPALLPQAVQDANPLGVPRLMDGQFNAPNR